jgi:DNA helicase-2/ATP-dependent DNA helicase PcrA
MSITSLISELNESQKIAASMPRQHALILAGAGCGKTKTIVARAAYLIANGTPANRIQILTFTRRSASEIVERVCMNLGDSAESLRASTFHTWCISLIRSAPEAFGCKHYSIIDRDDQEQVFKLVNKTEKTSQIPNAKTLCNIYSLARNTLQPLSVVLLKENPIYFEQKEKIAQIMLAYEAKKRERQYLDYDDILDIVAQTIRTSERVNSWVGSQYDYFLIDEMQDTNPLQWSLLEPLKKRVTLFCVGDDAQSIYGFRGADFKNVHSFSERVQGSVILKLEQNYRSTQEILDVSNWLLSESKLNYGKKLVAVRGHGNSLPALHTFADEWEEGRWIADDLVKRRIAGANWEQHMILVRSGYAARKIEVALLAAEIPYKFIGGMKLLESAHIKDVLSALRVIGNPRDEIGWMRFVTLWQGVGEVTANMLIEKIFSAKTIDECISILKNSEKNLTVASNVLDSIKQNKNNVSLAIKEASKIMEPMLAEKYGKKDSKNWDKRKGDFKIIENLAKKHTSILEFISEYLLDPIYGSAITLQEDKNVVTMITVHSAKGTECEVCYVVNVSTGAYPSAWSVGNEDDIEEERRVLYVAMTRAKNELILTRQGYRTWTMANPVIKEVKKDPASNKDYAQICNEDVDDELESYFLNALPAGLFNEQIHVREAFNYSSVPIIENKQPIHVGILLDENPISTPEINLKSSSNMPNEVIFSDWNSIINQLKMGRFLKEFARRCTLDSFDEDNCNLILDSRFAYMNDSVYNKKIEQSLSELFGKPIKLNISIYDQSIEESPEISLLPTVEF